MVFSSNYVACDTCRCICDGSEYLARMVVLGHVDDHMEQWRYDLVVLHSSVVACRMSVN